MSALATSLIVMRWGLLSAGLMYMASMMKIKCQQNSLKAASVVFTGVGVLTSCCFITALFGIDFSLQNWHSMADIATNAFTYALQQSPDIFIPNSF